MSYNIAEPFWAPFADPGHPAGVRLAWTWPPPGFIGTLDPLGGELYIQRSTSTDPAVNSHWPLSPAFVGQPSATFTPTPETGWETIKIIGVPPQYMTDDSPIGLGFRSYIDPMASAPTVNTYYRIVGFMQTDVSDFVELDWTPNVLSVEPGGSTQWSNIYGGTGSASGQTVVRDASGNIYTAGYFSGTMTPGGITLTALGMFDMFLIKTNAAGFVQWARRFGVAPSAQTTGGLIQPNCIGLDTSGNIIVGGTFYRLCNFGGSNHDSTGGDADCFIAKYSSAGAWVWDVVFGSNFPDVLNSLAIDSEDSVFVAGFVQGTITIQGTTINTYGTGIDPLFAKFDLSGNLLFVKNFYNAGSDYAEEVLVDPTDGSAYLIGSFNGYINLAGGQVDGNLLRTTGSKYLGFIAKYDNDGVHQWSRKYGGEGTYDTGTRFWAAALDSVGNIIVAGAFPSATGSGGGTNLGGGQIASSSWGEDGFVVKYSGVGGAWQSNVKIAGFQASAYRPLQIARDAADNVVVVGYTQRYANFGNGIVIENNDGLTHGFAAKLNPQFVTQWANAFSGSVISRLWGCSFTGIVPVVSGHFSGNETFGGKPLSRIGNQDSALILLNP